MLQIVRRPFYGRRPVQTVQRPGEVIYIPGDAAFAFYNVGGPTVDVRASFLSAANVEMVGLTGALENHFDAVFRAVGSEEDRLRMTGTRKQVAKASEEHTTLSVDEAAFGL
jgi:hypothetical protein